MKHTSSQPVECTFQHNKRNNPFMKTQHIILRKINALHQSKWVRPALMTMALIVTALGVIGCQPHH